MGTRLTQQKRGKGSPTYRAPSHRFFADIVYRKLDDAENRGTLAGQVVGLVDDPGRTALVVKIVLENGETVYNVAAEGICVGNRVQVGRGGALLTGSILPLESIPDGTPIFNVEAIPGDGGRMARAGGAAAYVVSRDEETGRVSVRLASKKVRVLNPSCRATVGVAAGGGRLEKPFKKAGTHAHAMWARNKYYPIVRGTAMSAYDHPHGGKSFGSPTTVSRSTPPGAKTGQVAARRTGRRRGKVAE
ncbi:MAG: 50S ribosomal protein L2 [Candidatus Micrarchaeota archaeon]|nr:50S ribosomal protein L2 [Candidatus Micrarchaeota archaeon]